MTKNLWTKPNNFTQRSDYAARGLWLFAMHGIVDEKCTCGKEHENPKDIGKHPATAHGYREAVPAQDFKYNAPYNVAVALGEISGCFVLDVDDIEGYQSLENLPPLPATFTVKTGNGQHYYFKYPDFPLKSNQGVLGENLEIKSNGSSAHVPPSKHISGRDYVVIDESPIAEAPQWIFDTINAHNEKRESERLERQRAYDINYADKEAWSEDEVKSMLDEIDPNLGYYDWIQIGMALNEGGYPFTLWDQWSSKGASYIKSEMQHHWRSFKRGGGVTMGSLVNMAQLNGWRPPVREQAERPEVDLSRIQGFLNKSYDEIPFDIPLKVSTPLAIIAKKTSTLGFDPLSLPGLIGDTVRWIVHHAMLPQPELALFNTLAFAGAVFGRRYASPANTRTNIYMVGIAGTGTGKDHSRKCINSLAVAAGLQKYIGGNRIRSDSGLARAVETEPSQVMMIDEFGLFMQALGDPMAPAHIKSCSSLLMEFYSTSSSVYNHGTYADIKNKPIIIHNPNLAIYGTTTEGMYAKSLRKSAIESGDINRFIALKPAVEFPPTNHDAPYIVMADHAELVASWKAFEPKSLGESINSSNIKPKINVMTWGVCNQIRRDLLDEQQRRVQVKPFGALWARLYENTIKIAMIQAIARDMTNPIFCPEDFAIGEAIVRNAIHYMESVAAEHMSDSETETHNLEILRFIKDSGGEVTKSHILAKMRKLKKRELDDLLTSMIESEAVEVVKKSTTGRPVSYYRISK